MHPCPRDALVLVLHPCPRDTSGLIGIGKADGRRGSNPSPERLVWSGLALKDALAPHPNPIRYQIVKRQSSALDTALPNR